MKTITLRWLIPSAIALALALSFSVMPVLAHDGEDHGDDASSEVEQKRELLIQIIQLLQQIIAERGSAAMMTHDEHTHTEIDGSAELLISVEVHDGRVHVHVDQLGKEEVSFFLDDYEISDEAGIITAIALETGFSEAEITEAAIFPEADEMEHEHDDDLAGIHIMSDGTVMLGNGDVVEGATVTADGKIMLADGDIVEPEMDMR